MNTVFHKMSIENFEEGYSDTDTSNYASVNEEQINENNTPTVNKTIEETLLRNTIIPRPPKYNFLDRTIFFGYKNKTILMFTLILIIIYYLYSCQ